MRSSQLQLVAACVVVFTSRYTNMSVIVDQMFPSRIEPANDYSQFSYWREPLLELESLPGMLDHAP